VTGIVRGRKKRNNSYFSSPPSSITLKGEKSLALRAQKRKRGEGGGNETFFSYDGGVQVRKRLRGVGRESYAYNYIGIVGSTDSLFREKGGREPLFLDQGPDLRSSEGGGKKGLCPISSQGRKGKHRKKKRVVASTHRVKEREKVFSSHKRKKIGEKSSRRGKARRARGSRGGRERKIKEPWFF